MTNRNEGNRGAPRPPLCGQSSVLERQTPAAFGNLACGASRLLGGGGVKRGAGVPERWCSSGRDGRCGETMEGSAGTEDSGGSILISSDEDTQMGMLGDSGAYSIQLLEDDAWADNTLWLLENEGSQKQENVVRSARGQGVEVELGGIAEDVDSSSDSLSNWSTASGPSFPVDCCPPALCKNCEDLFTKMKKIKGWKKTMDHNPTSLSCDQWILKKRWQPRRYLNVKGRLWTHLRRIRKNLSCSDATGMKGTQVLCSRPHVFLQRNLMRCKTAYAQNRQRGRKAKVHSLAKLGGHRKKGRRKKAPPFKESKSLSVSLPSDEDVSVRVDTRSISLAGDRARRVLDFDVTEPLGLSTVKPGAPSSVPPERLGVYENSGMSVPDPGRRLEEFSLVGKGGFRSMLMELKSCRSTIVEELHSSVP